MAKKIFNSPELRDQLNQVIHPVVRAEFVHFANENTGPVFNEAAILFETGAYKQMDANILIVAPLEIRIERIMERDHCSEKEALSRIDTQWSDEKKKPLADFVLYNDDEHSVLKQFEEILNKLTTSHR